VTRRIRETQNDPELRVWQGRYHDHIIRTETALNHIREYIIHNPARWRKGNYSGVAKAGMNGVPKKASTSAENMDSPCLRAVER
jgi:hypothetical protein